MQLDTIFFGNTPSEQRKYALYFLTKARKHYDKIVIPCVGQFALVHLAVEAGFDKKNIRTSDISLFSSLLGFLYAGKPICDLGYKISDQYLDQYNNYEYDITKAAFIFYIMKIKQIELLNKTAYMNNFYNHFIAHEDKFIEEAVEQLSKHVNYYKGIQYSVEDLRKEVSQDFGKDTLVLVNPPAYKKGYEKMFNFGEALQFKVDIEEWDWNKEYFKTYNEGKERACAYLWYRYKTVEGLPKDDVVFGREYTKDRFDYWLFTKPEIMASIGIQKKLKMKSDKKFNGMSASIIPFNYKLEPTSKISFKVVNDDVALYYRDLWAHKLGNTKAEQYVVMLIDGYVFGVTGFHLADLRRMSSDEIFEVFGFNAPLKEYKNANRLLMMAITCKEFARFIKSTQKTNRFFEINQFKTTCLSKYRKVKLNNGLLKIRDREKMKDGMYKIVYICDMYDRSYADCMKLYLDELAGNVKLNDLEVDNGDKD